MSLARDEISFDAEIERFKNYGASYPLDTGTQSSEHRPRDPPNDALHKERVALAKACLEGRNRRRNVWTQAFIESSRWLKIGDIESRKGIGKGGVASAESRASYRGAVGAADAAKQSSAVERYEKELGLLRHRVEKQDQIIRLLRQRLREAGLSDKIVE